MPKQSREQIIAELDARKVGYGTDMSYNELVELLNQARQVAREQIEEQVPKEFLGPKPEEPIDYSGILCGLSTIQDLHRRITLLERKMEKLLNG
jgi:hypothetical protein